MPKQKKQITKIKSEKEDKQCQIVANRYSVSNKLGCGSYGTVFLVSDLKTSEAEKVLKKIHIGDLQPNETISAVSEARLLSKLVHPGIVKFHDSFIDREFFCIITEYCEGGDLDVKLQAWKKAGKSADKSLVLTWFVQLILAAQYIHQRRVLHRDLKTRNIFLKNNIVKIGDFGISRILAGSTDIATTFTGTPYFMAPEILKHEGYNSKSDIWSLGVIFYEMCTLKKAFSGNNLMAVMTNIVNGEIPKLPSKYNEDIHSIYESMLCRDQKKRITATEILKNPFIAQHLEKLKVKLSAGRTIDRKIAQREAMEIASALSEGKFSKANRCSPGTNNNKLNVQNSRRPLTPKEQMKIRKQQQADKEMEQLKKLTVKTYNQNRRECSDIKKRLEHSSAEDFDHNNLKTNNVVVQSDNIRIGIIEATNDGGECSLDVYSLPADDNVFENNLPSTPTSITDLERARAYTHCFGDDEDETVCQGRKYTHCFGGEDTGSSGDEESTTLMNQHIVVEDGDGENKVFDSNIAELDEESDNSESNELTNVSSIPEDAEQAETFYSNYDDFESDTDDDDDTASSLYSLSSSSSSSSLTSLSDVIGTDDAAVVGNGGENDGVENDVSNKTDDYKALVDCMENALELGDKDVQSTFGDSVVSTSTTSTSSLSIRQEKIQNLRKECIRLLGDEGFQKVYSYLHEVRFNSKRTVTEDNIMRRLRKLVGSTRDCFLVEQLLFLEKQNQIYNETF